MLSRFRKSWTALVIGGVLALGFGAWMSRGWAWDTTTGTVENCAFHSTKKKSNSWRGPYVSCRTTWTADGASHTAIVDFDGRNDLTGTKQEIAVDGNAAMAPSERVYGPLLAGAGVVLIGAGVLLRRRSSVMAA